MRLGSSQFALTIAGLLPVFGVVFIVIAPDWHDWYYRRAVKQFEQELGFQSGPVSLSDASSQPLEAWGITAVVAGGRFEQFGVRPGDIPFAYHGHGAASDLYYALHEASRGKSAHFDVVNVQDRSLGGRALRRILVPGAPR
jgi:hypothetical protein